MQLRFKVGDRVKIVSNYYESAGIEFGTTGTVTYADINDSMFPYSVRFDNFDSSLWCEADELRLANSIPVISISDLI